MFVVIPAYEPDERLVGVVRDVKAALQADIIVVDDGSGPLYASYFAMAEKHGATVLTHETNKGKGAALKTAFRHLLTINQADDTVVTVDSDGQHVIADIIKVANRVAESPNQVVLGVRDFIGQVPFRSRFGNRLTALLFRLATGVAIKDTQTGLRGFSTGLLPWLVTLQGDRFEYEFHMLLEAEQAGYGLAEEPIETIYIEQNHSSHFRPIQDSIRIYAPFLKFMASSSLSGILDAVLFFLLMAVTKELLLSVIVARVLSASVQCVINAKVVFNSKQSPLVSIMRYSLLVIGILACNYLLLNGLVSLGIGLMIAKVLTESVLFIVSYRLQKTVVFS